MGIVGPQRLVGALAESKKALTPSSARDGALLHRRYEAGEQREPEQLKRSVNEYMYHP